MCSSPHHPCQQHSFLHADLPWEDLLKEALTSTHRDALLHLGSSLQVALDYNPDFADTHNSPARWITGLPSLQVECLGSKKSLVQGHPQSMYLVKLEFGEQKFKMHDQSEHSIHYTRTIQGGEPSLETETVCDSFQFILSHLYDILVYWTLKEPMSILWESGYPC